MSRARKRSTRRFRVLVVEDHDLDGKLFAILLEAAGCEVRVARDAVTAWAASRSVRPNAILLDLRLPGMDGIAFAQRVRKDARLRDVRIVATSAYGGVLLETQARAAGCDDFLRKPIDTRTLVQHLVRERVTP